MNKIKAITFDATGTLFKVRGSVGGNYEKIFNKYNIKLNKDKLNKNFLKIFSDLSKEYPSYGYAKYNNDGKFYYDKSGNEICGFKWWQHLMKSLVETTSTNFKSKEQIDSIPIDAYKELYDCFGSNINSSKLITSQNQHEFWEVYDDVYNTLDALKDRGIRLSVISNFDERLHTILKTLDLIKYFSLSDNQILKVKSLSPSTLSSTYFPNQRYDFITTSIESGYQKPSEQIFDFSYQKLLLTQDHSSIPLSKDQIMYVGDSIGKDCIGSNNFGFIPCLLNRSNESLNLDKYQNQLPINNLKIINNLNQLLN